MAATVPPNTRLLAFSRRGYGGSSPFSEDVSACSDIRDRLGDDFASVTTAFVERLSLLAHPDSRVKVICWSLGHVSLLKAYHLLYQGRLSDAKKHVLSSQVSEIIFFEPPASSALGFEPSASVADVRRNQAEASVLDPAQQIQGLLDLFFGVWDFPDYFMAGAETQKPGERPGFSEMFLPTMTLNGDPDIKERAQDGILEFGCLPYCIAAVTPITPEGRQDVQDALKAMLSAPGIKSLKTLNARNSLPECIEGPLLLGAELRHIDLQIKSGTDIKTIILDGRYMHYVHNQAPELVWANIT